MYLTVNVYIVLLTNYLPREQMAACSVTESADQLNEEFLLPTTLATTEKEERKEEGKKEGGGSTATTNNTNTNKEIKLTKLMETASL